MNNYDSNSQNDNIELNVSYDSSLSQMNFDDFELENTRIPFSRDSSLFIIGDVTKPFYKKTALNKMTKAQLIQLDDYFQLLCPYTYDDTTKKELIDELKNVTIKQYYEYLASEYSWGNISEQFAHDYYVSRGYCQGDAIYIINVDEEFRKETKAYIDHIMWDSPVYISIQINDDEELREWDLLDDEYEYNKDDVIAKINELDISDYAKKWLADNLPSQPEYR